MPVWIMVWMEMEFQFMIVRLFVCRMHHLQVLTASVMLDFMIVQVPDVRHVSKDALVVQELLILVKDVLKGTCLLVRNV